MPSEQEERQHNSEQGVGKPFDPTYGELQEVPHLHATVPDLNAMIPTAADIAEILSATKELVAQETQLAERVRFLIDSCSAMSNVAWAATLAATMEAMRRTSLTGEVAARLGEVAATLSTATHLMRASSPLSYPSELVQRWLDRRFPGEEIAAITQRATEVLGTKEKATLWLSSPNLATDNKAPIDLIGDELGYKRVMHLLGRIEVGALA